MSYATNLADGYRQASIYVGSILKGTGRPICPSFNQPSSTW